MNRSFKSAEEAFDNFDSFLNNLVDRGPLHIDLTVEVDNYNSDPTLVIELNHCILYNQSLSKGIHHVDISTDDFSDSNQLKFSMLGKADNDTLMENNIILRDKFIKFVDFKINNFDILADLVLFQTQFWYTVSNQPTHVSSGLWQKDSVLGLDFTMPFTLWYQQVTTKQTALPESLRFQSHGDTAELSKQLIENAKKLKY